MGHFHPFVADEKKNDLEKEDLTVIRCTNS